MTPPWADDPDLATVFQALEAAGGTVRVVGGAVRDWQLVRSVGDLDLATTLEPAATKAALSQAGLQAIPTGLSHGTITAIVNHRPFEITTLRRDVETDGRHAVVAFTTDWHEDAARRDFTINALYADLDGTLHDPLGQGLNDLAERRLCFVGNAGQRIQEDYLRILRFFRFQAQIDLTADRHGFAACVAHRQGLDSLSAERIWQEMAKLLAASGRAAAIDAMKGAGVLEVILPEAQNPDFLETLTPGDAVLALADLLPDVAAARAVGARWKLSNRERARLAAAVVTLDPEVVNDPAALKRLAFREGAQAVADRLRLARQPERAEMIAVGPLPIPPVQGQDVLDLGMAPGPTVGDVVRGVIDWWVERDFAPDRAACLAEMKRRVDAA